MLDQNSATRSVSSSPVEPIGACHIVSGDLWAGAEVQVASLLHSLSKDRKTILCAILLNPGRLASEIEGLGLECLVLPESQMGFVKIYRLASRFLKAKRIHVLHSHRYKENLLAALLAWRLRIPVLVQTRHGWIEPLTGFREIKQRLIQGADDLITRWAVDRVIGVSTELSERLGRVLGPEKIVMIPNGINFDQVRSELSVAEARRRLGIPADNAVVGTACRLEPVKRLDILLRAAQQMACRNPHIRFVIAGEGRERAGLQALAKELKIEDQVLFLGHRDDIFDVLRALDLIFISSDHEGLPMVLLEAMAMGIPVIARRVGGIPEVITNGVTGILVDSNSPANLAAACQDLLADKEKRGRLSEAAVSTVRERFSADTTARQVEGLYRSLVSAQ